MNPAPHGPVSGSRCLAVKASEVSSNMTQALDLPLPNPVKKLICRLPRQLHAYRFFSHLPLRPACLQCLSPQAPPSSASGLTSPHEKESPFTGPGRAEGGIEPISGSGGGQEAGEHFLVNNSSCPFPDHVWTWGESFKDNIRTQGRVATTRLKSVLFLFGATYLHMVTLVF